MNNQYKTEYKSPCRALILFKLNAIGQPGLNGVSAVVSFPLFQTFVIATFCFNDLTGVRILIDFHLAGFARARFRRGYRSAVCSGLMKPDTHLGENARQIEVSDDQTTPLLYS